MPLSRKCAELGETLAGNKVQLEETLARLPAEPAQLKKGAAKDGAAGGAVGQGLGRRAGRERLWAAVRAVEGEPI